MCDLDFWGGVTRACALGFGTSKAWEVLGPSNGSSGLGYSQIPGLWVLLLCSGVPGHQVLFLGSGDQY